MRRLSRARYHRAVRHLKRAETRMRTEKMAEALISNRSRDLWSAVKRMFYVEVSKCAMHLGHSISSGDKTEIVKYAKRSFGVALIYLELILVIFLST